MRFASTACWVGNTSLAFKATIDDTGRFLTSKALGAHLGLTPRVFSPARSTAPATLASAATE